MFYIPDIGDIIQLKEDWTFSLYYEHRNRGFQQTCKIITKSADHHYPEYGSFLTQIIIPAKSLLSVDRIYIRKGNKEYSSLTFWVKDWVGDKKKNGKRFWAKLPDVNRIVPLQIINKDSLEVFSDSVIENNNLIDDLKKEKVLKSTNEHREKINDTAKEAILKLINQHGVDDVLRQKLYVFSQECSQAYMNHVYNSYKPYVSCDAIRNRMFSIENWHCVHSQDTISEHIRWIQFEHGCECGVPGTTKLKPPQFKVIFDKDTLNVKSCELMQ